MSFCPWQYAVSLCIWVSFFWSYLNYIGVMNLRVRVFHHFAKFSANCHFECCLSLILLSPSVNLIRLLLDVLALPSMFTDFLFHIFSRLLESNYYLVHWISNLISESSLVHFLFCLVIFHSVLILSYIWGLYFL